MRTDTSIKTGNNEFYIYTKEWKAAKDAAKKAGYTTYLAWGAADPYNKDWFYMQQVLKQFPVIYMYIIILAQVRVYYLKMPL